MKTETETQAKVTVYREEQCNENWPSENFIQCIALFNGKLRLIPKEYQDSAQIIIEGIPGYDNEPISEIEIFYLRNLTSEEIIKQKAAEKAKEQAIRDHELKELERLRLKYKN